MSTSIIMHPMSPLVQGFDVYLLGIVAFIEIARRVKSERLRRLLISSLGLAAYHFSHQKRRRIEDNLQNAFPSSLSPVELERITRGVFHAFWQQVFDWSYDDSTALAADAEIVGTEYLRAALAQGRGVILWESSAYGSRTIAKHLLHANGFDVTQVHGQTHAGGLGIGERGMSRLLERLILPYFDSRTRRIVREVVYLDENASLGAARGLMQQLARNAILCVSFEGQYGQKHLTLPFLNKPYPFATGLVSLAKLAGAPLIPMYCTPGANTLYRLIIGPPIPMPRELERDRLIESVLTHQVSELEAHICQHPEWYRNWNLLPGN